MHTGPKLRAATRADVPAIVALLRDDDLGRAREGEPDDPLYVRAFDAMAGNPDNRYYVIEHDGDIAGCAQLTVITGLSRRAAKRAVIEAVRISRQCRGAGLGNFLMRELIGIAARHGCALVQLTSDKMRKDAHRFYERLGFRRSHEGFKMELTQPNGRQDP